MKPTHPTVSLTVYPQRPLKRYATITATIRKGKTKKHITSDITAPIDLLQKFDCRGDLKPGETAPKWLQEDINRFYYCAQAIGMKQLESGNFETITSPEFSTLVRDLYFTTTTAERG